MTSKSKYDAINEKSSAFVSEVKSLPSKRQARAAPIKLGAEEEEPPQHAAARTGAQGRKRAKQKLAASASGAKRKLAVASAADASTNVSSVDGSDTDSAPPAKKPKEKAKPAVAKKKAKPAAVAPAEVLRIRKSNDDWEKEFDAGAAGGIEGGERSAPGANTRADSGGPKLLRDVFGGFGLKSSPKTPAASSSAPGLDFEEDELHAATESYSAATAFLETYRVVLGHGTDMTVAAQAGRIRQHRLRREEQDDGPSMMTSLEAVAEMVLVGDAEADHDLEQPAGTAAGADADASEETSSESGSDSDEEDLDPSMPESDYFPEIDRIMVSLGNQIVSTRKDMSVQVAITMPIKLRRLLKMKTKPTVGDMLEASSFGNLRQLVLKQARKAAKQINHPFGNIKGDPSVRSATNLLKLSPSLSP